jgi:hypothetical protein
MGNNNNAMSKIISNNNQQRHKQQHPSWLLLQLQQIDEVLSRPLFELSLPPMIEILYSVPTTFFGLIPSLIVGPTWLAIYGLSLMKQQQNNDDNNNNNNNNNGIDDDNNVLFVLSSVAWTLTIVFVVAWMLFLLQGWRRAVTQFLGKKIFYLIGVPWNILFLHYHLIIVMGKENESQQQQQQQHEDQSTATDNNNNGTSTSSSLTVSKIYSIALYSLYLWSVSVLVVLFLKRYTKRLRPCTTKRAAAAAARSLDWIRQRKPYTHAVTSLLIKYESDQSFPSGDAATSVCFAVPLSYLVASPGGAPAVQFNHIIAFVMVFLACTGRVYILAHYVIDVVVGAMIPCMVHSLSTYLGVGVFDMVWWHPLLANILVAAYAKLTNHYEAETKKHKK